METFILFLHTAAFS